MILPYSWCVFPERQPEDLQENGPSGVVGKTEELPSCDRRVTQWQDPADRPAFGDEGNTNPLLSSPKEQLFCVRSGRERKIVRRLGAIDEISSACHI